MRNLLFLNILKNSDGKYSGNLEYYFSIIFQAPNVYLPYHNFRHMCHITYQTYQAICYYGQQINPIEARKLLIAAMFHDYGHTGSTQDGDIVNIENAINGITQHILDTDREYLDDIINLIRITQYPHSREPVSLSEQILCDADISQTFDTVWLQQILFGLSRELGMSPFEFLLKQKDFIKNVNFYTTWGQETFNPEKPTIIKELIAYESILKNHL